MNSVLQHIQNNSSAVITWQREMTRRPALGPENQGTGEDEKASWLRDELIRIGITDIRDFPCPDSRVPSGIRPNIAAVIPGKTQQTLWIIGHMDVVPAGDESLWTTPPFDLHVDGDYVCGRGVEDNQQAIVTGMLIADALLATKTTPDVSLGLLFVADEETGMQRGFPYMLQADPHLIAPDDLVVVPDMGNSAGSMVQIAEKGCLWLQIAITGKQCHASTPDKGVNSLVAASACVLELEQLYRLFPKKNKIFSPSWSTFVPSKKDPNVENINTLPGRDVFYLDCRVLPEYDIDAVEQTCRDIVEATVAKYGATATVTAVHKVPAAPATSPDSQSVQRLLTALKKSRGIDGELSGSGGQTIASCLRQRNMPAVVWATLIPNAHVPNERSSIRNTIEDAKTLTHMLFGA